MNSMLKIDSCCLTQIDHKKSLRELVIISVCVIFDIYSNCKSIHTGIMVKHS